MFLLLACTGSVTAPYARCHLVDDDNDGYPVAIAYGDAPDSGKADSGLHACDDASAAELLQGVEPDCDDANSGVNPGAVERCFDEVDDDCDGMLEQDADGDGAWGSGDCATDCDDADPAVFPEAEELCNLADDDCDGLVDEDSDQDADGWTDCGGDCDDGDALVHPGVEEGCDGVDSNCDGSVGEDEADGDGDGWTACDGDCDGDDPTVSPSATETCNGLDDDCSGGVELDEVDADGDGVLACADCDDGDADREPGLVEWCDGLDNDCDDEVDEGFDADGDGWTSCEGDCDDADGAVFPGATEACDGADGNCDGLLSAEEADADGDGHLACVDDCDDARADVWTGATETCNGEDDDCDDVVPDDELDLDEDGASACEGDCDDGNPLFNLFDLDADGASACEGDCDDLDADLNVLDADGDGWTSCDGDCDDLDPGFSPGAAESCNEIDDDCDGAIDEDFPDDNADAIADCIELCDGVDNDEDGSIDEGFSDGSVDGTWVSASAGTPEGPGSYAAPFDSIAAAIARSLTDSPCAIRVSPGSYPDAFELPGNPLEITSTDGPELTFLTGSADAPILTVGSTVTRDTVLSGFSFTGGSLMDGSGSGIEAARQGAAVQISGGSPTFSCVRFEGNEAADRGAAVFVDGGSPRFEDSLFADNLAWGAAHDDGGGALWIGGGASAEVHGSTFLRNFSGSSGGAVVVGEGASLALTASRFAGNTSDSLGGAVAFYGGGGTVSGVLFQGNVGVVGGGLLLDIADASVVVENVTLVENDGTSGFGGGIAFQNDGAVVRSAILAWPGTGGLIGWATDDYAVEPSFTLSHSLLYDETDAWIYSNFETDTEWVGVEGNVGGDPRFASFDADGDLLDDDLSLGSASPARDAGEGSDADGSVADMGGLGGLTPYEPAPTCFGSLP